MTSSIMNMMSRRNRTDLSPAGRISRSAAFTVTVALFGVGSLLLAFTGLAPLLSGFVLIGLIVLYDAWHKTNPLSPLVMASTRVMVYVTASLAFIPQVSAPLVIWSILLALYIIGLTYLAKMESRPGLCAVLARASARTSRDLCRLTDGRLGIFPLAALRWLDKFLLVPCLCEAQLRRGDWFAYCRRIAARCARACGSTGSTVGVTLALLAFGLTLFFQRYIKGT